MCSQIDHLPQYCILFLHVFCTLKIKSVLVVVGISLILTHSVTFVVVIQIENRHTQSKDSSFHPTIPIITCNSIPTYIHILLVVKAS